MPDALDMALAFLKGTDWASATHAPLAQDASARSYARLTNSAGQTAILAKDPSPESRAAFASLSAHLRGLGLSAPAVLAIDDNAGLLLLEDLGDALYTRVIAADAKAENSLYSCAIDTLLMLSGAAAPKLTPLSPDVMADQAMVAFEWYAGQTAPSIEPLLRHVFESQVSAPDALMLRDVHAGNLIWLPDRIGLARVGLLDFQDAMLCSRLYDVVSLIDDARRDLPRDLADRLYAKAATGLGRDLPSVRIEAAALSLQRNLRILGVFSRLCLRDGKSAYLPFIPRVWAHIQHALDQLGRQNVTEAMRDALPEPTPAYLQELEDACGTIQKR